MLAVIETGGKQYTVQVGDRITIEKISDQNGENVVFSRVLLVSDNGSTEIGTPFLDTTVSGKIVQEGRGEKIRVYKMHAKKRYQKTQGHRQSYMKVEITGIGGKAPAKAAAKAKASEETISEEAPKTKASKTASEKATKPAAKKPAAPKKTPAKKSVAKKKS